MTGEILDYTTQVVDTKELRALAIFANLPNGLLTVSRLSAYILGVQNEETLVSKVMGEILANKKLDDVFTSDIELQSLGQIMQVVEDFARQAGGVAMVGYTDDTPDELRTALDNLSDAEIFAVD